MLFLKSQNIEMKPHVVDNTFFRFKFLIGSTELAKEVIENPKDTTCGESIPIYINEDLKCFISSN